MQTIILDQAKVAKKGAGYIERAGPVSGTICLVGQPRKMVNFIREISDYMEPSHPAFTIMPSQ